MYDLPPFLVRLNTVLYRLSGGSLTGRIEGYEVLLLKTTGRRSGEPRTSPLLYLRDGEDYLVVGSNWGKPHPPGWLANLRANPDAAIQVMSQTLPVRAEIVETGERRDALYQRFKDANPRYIRYEGKTARTIAVVVLHPASRA